MNILLTGATGFLGSHILKGLINNTNHNVIVCKRSFSNVYRIENLLKNERIKFYNIDITDLEDIFKNENINTIIHCATNYGRHSNSVQAVLETNLMFPIRLLDLSVLYRTSHFINTDSFFNKEGFSYQYLLDYSLSKKSLLLWLKYFSKKLTVSNMVLEHIFGEDDNKEKFVFQMFDKIAIKQIKEIDLTQGEQKRDFIYVEDVVNAYIEVLKRKNNGFESYEIGTGEPVSIKDFVVAIKENSNSKTKLNFGKIAYRQGEIECSCANLSQNFNWKPKYSYKTAIQKIITYYGENQ